MSFSISGIFKPAKQAEPVSNVAPQALETNAADTKVPQADATEKKPGNGGSCCGGCGGGGH